MTNKDTVELNLFQFQSCMSLLNCYLLTHNVTKFRKNHFLEQVLNTLKLTPRIQNDDTA